MERYKKIGYFGILIIALGINLSTIYGEKFGALGIVFIAIGGLLFIAAMNEKKKSDKENG